MVGVGGGLSGGHSFSLFTIAIYLQRLANQKNSQDIFQGCACCHILKKKTTPRYFQGCVCCHILKPLFNQSSLRNFDCQKQEICYLKESKKFFLSNYMFQFLCTMFQQKFENWSYFRMNTIYAMLSGLASVWCVSMFRQLFVSLSTVRQALLVPPCSPLPLITIVPSHHLVLSMRAGFIH